METKLHDCVYQLTTRDFYATTFQRRFTIIFSPVLSRTSVSIDWLLILRLFDSILKIFDSSTPRLFDLSTIRFIDSLTLRFFDSSTIFFHSLFFLYFFLHHIFILYYIILYIIILFIYFFYIRAHWRLGVFCYLASRLHQMALSPVIKTTNISSCISSYR